jgi:rhodanese-related sulfurtransferase
MSYGTIRPAEYAERAGRNEAPPLIDVREEAEFGLARVEGARLLPLSRFDEWAPALDPEEEIVFMCHHGVRSAQVCAFLARAGFRRLHNLAGGIDLWSVEVDPSVPRY